MPDLGVRQVLQLPPGGRAASQSSRLLRNPRGHLASPESLLPPSAPPGLRKHAASTSSRRHFQTLQCSQTLARGQAPASTPPACGDSARSAFASAPGRWGAGRGLRPPSRMCSAGLRACPLRKARVDELSPRFCHTPPRDAANVRRSNALRDGAPTGYGQARMRAQARARYILRHRTWPSHTTLHACTMHCNASMMQYTAHTTVYHATFFNFSSYHSITQHLISQHLIFDFIALHCTALHCIALPCLALPCLALPCLALPCLALPSLA